MSSNAHLAHRAALGTVGLALGGLMAWVEFVFCAFVRLARVIPAARPRIDAISRTLVDLNRRRLVAFLNFDDHLCVVPDRRRGESYLVRRAIIGMTGSWIFVLISVGVGSALIMGWQVVRAEPIGGGTTGGNTWYEVAAIVMMGFLLLFLAVWGLIGVAMLERRLAVRFFGPSEEDLLRRRVSELSSTRAKVVDAVNDERRRIERDLHDGVQQRLVALGMLLGRALRAKDPHHATKLLKQAHEESQRTLDDLRNVTWRVYPAALDREGLHAALEGVADRASVPVEVRYDVSERLDLPTETVAYFVASEAVTNALKHGGPDNIVIAVNWENEELSISIRDDGRGGADVTGSGLSGLASRVAAADGVFEVTSPPGGPTVVTARIYAPPPPRYDDDHALQSMTSQRHPGDEEGHMSIRVGGDPWTKEIGELLLGEGGLGAGDPR